MRGVFDDRELQEAAPRRDTELTLNSFTLLFIFFALVLLCGLCFGLGYSLGHRESQGSTPGPVAASDVRTSAHADDAHAKPSANAQGDSGPLANAAANPQASLPSSASSTSAQTSPVAAQSGSLSGASPSAQSVQVKPALGTEANAVQTARPSASAVGPALASGALMVQIAAVSQTEDADVLMSALRRRGYAIVSRREPLDGLIHVRIGPFKTRDEADTWRQKLLNDGYNAIIQP
jgi:cell division septation protein DedD